MISCGFDIIFFQHCSACAFHSSVTLKRESCTSSANGALGRQERQDSGRKRQNVITINFSRAGFG
jgi:hypothetical protein